MQVEITQAMSEHRNDKFGYFEPHCRITYFVENYYAANCWAFDRTDSRKYSYSKTYSFTLLLLSLFAVHEFDLTSKLNTNFTSIAEPVWTKAT